MATSVIICFAFLILCVASFNGEDFELTQEKEPVTQTCLRCMCEATFGCKPNHKCTEDGPCGPWRINRPFWEDAKSPTLPGESPDNRTSFKNCVEDIDCAHVTIQQYMSQFQRDCNGDNKIDCDDFIRIHIRGIDECVNPLTETDDQRYTQCKKNELELVHAV